MTSRFASNLAIAILGGALATLSLVLADPVVRWLALGAGAAAVAVTLAGFAARGRGSLQRTLDVPVALIGGWTVVASGSYGHGTLRWLSFAAGTALCALGIAGLIAHEVRMERWVRRARRVAATPAPISASAGPESEDGRPVAAIARP